jgi:CRP/FNR family cyclic AMP-dependent transcriptional regulator
MEAQEIGLLHESEVRVSVQASDSRTARRAPRALLGGVEGHGPLARTIRLDPGPVDLQSRVGGDETWLGLLILDGALLLQTRAGRARVGWLAGADDLIRPWELSGLSLTAGSEWRAITPTSLALLDKAFSRRAEPMPGLTISLVERAARTTRWLIAKSVILSAPLIEERLLLLFALMADRWGRVTPAGVRIDLPVTHELLAVLCGARRPSVTIALRALSDQGLVARNGDGRWLLRRDVSAELPSKPSCWEEYAEALGLSDP